MPKTSETMEYFKKLGVRSFKKSSLTLNGNGFRPCFRPDGKLMTIHANKK